MVTPPGGRVGAWINVVICGAILVAAPVVAFTTVHPVGIAILIGVAILAICVFMETQFVRILLRQLKAARK